MTWISHKALTGTFIYLLTGDAAAAIFAAVGSVIPDALEGMPGDGGSQDAWRRYHRRGTHYAPFYIAVFLIAYLYLGWKGIWRIGIDNLFQLALDEQFWGIIGLYIVSYLSLGAAFHILEDAISGTVPGWSVKKRVGVRWIKTGSPQEYVMTIPISLLFFWLSHYLH